MSEHHDSSRNIIVLTRAMESGKSTLAQSKRRLDEIEAAYKSPFLPTQFTPKPKPWDKVYLSELCEAVTFGKTSKAYLLHIAEVSDAIFRPIRMLKTVIAAVVLLGAIIVAWVLFRE